VLLIQPVFNVLVFIYGILPGHNFGLAIILFTILVRLVLWPLLKKQLHQSIKMRALQPELKRIKQQTKGDRQKQSMLMMELYKERGINPFSSIGVMLLQLPILLALYACLRRIIDDPHQVHDFAYAAVQHLPSIHDLAANIHLFDNTLFGIVDLSKNPISAAGTYWPAMIIVVLSAIVQFFQSRQLMPVDKNARKLRTIMKEAAASGQQADQSEVSASLSKSMIYVFPFMILLIGVSLPAALGLYWLISSLVALVQQTIILRRDSEELTAKVGGGAGTKTTAANRKSSGGSTVTIKMNGKVISKKVNDIPEAEVVEAAGSTALKKPSKPKQKPSQKRGSSSKQSSKGRKR